MDVEEEIIGDVCWGRNHWRWTLKKKSLEMGAEEEIIGDGRLRRNYWREVLKKESFRFFRG
jgi:hypothetical protein